MMFERDDDELPQYTVRVVAERVGVPTATLRSWNQRYGVGPPDHSPGRHRLYSENDIVIVRHMHELIGQGASPRSAARAAIDSVRPVCCDTSPLMSAALDLDVVTVGRLLDRHLRHFGVLDTWDHFVRPAFADIEVRQAEGQGCIDVEHALSWAVSRSLQRLPIAPPDATAAIILACTAGETHSLALEALRAALGERGRGALMLGADVPLSAMVDAVKRTEVPATAVLWSHASDTADTETVNAVAAYAEVLVGGPGWEAVTAPYKAVRLDSLRAAVQRFVPDE